MEKKPTPENTDAKELNIMLPEELIKRIYLFCDERDMTVQDFATDAIIEKLQRVPIKREGRKSDCRRKK